MGISSGLAMLLTSETTKKLTWRERVRTAAMPRTSGGRIRQRYKEDIPGISTRILPSCFWRAEVLRQWDLPCCGGTIRREFTFCCNHKDKAERQALSHECARCKLDKTDNRTPTARNGLVLAMPWGDKAATKNIIATLPKLGYEVHVIRRGIGAWLKDAVGFIEKHHGDVKLFVTWQRLLPRWGLKIKAVLNRYNIPQLYIDFGVRNHYNSAVFDTSGENAASAMPNRLDEYEADADRRAAADAEASTLMDMRSQLEARAAYADKNKDVLKLRGIPKDFIYVVLQRTGDLVCKNDAPGKRTSMQRLMVELLAEATRQKRFVVIKLHPLDDKVKLDGMDLTGPYYRIIPKTAMNRAALTRMQPPNSSVNDMIMAWLLKNCSHMITVNSTVIFSALALHTPVCALGSGWFTGNHVVNECKTLSGALLVRPKTPHARMDRFMLHMLSRNRTIDECKDVRRVGLLLDLLHPKNPGEAALSLPDKPLNIIFHNKQVELGPRLSLDEVTAFIVTWKRQEAAQALVTRLVDLGLKHIWVWCNENAPVPKGATRWFVSSDNIGNWQRYHMAGLVETSHILLADDDLLLTEAGLEGLLNATRTHRERMLGLWGCTFKPPFDHYHHRTVFLSHKIKGPKVVDYVAPLGFLAPKQALQATTGVTKYWEVAEQIMGDHTLDDLTCCIAARETAALAPVVVPTKAPGYKFGKEAQGPSSLATKPGRRAKLYACLPKFIEAGWKPLRMNGAK